MANQWVKRLKIKHLLIIVVILIIVGGSWICFINLGTFLVHRDPLNKTTYSLILMGSIPDRVLEATDLYNNGLTDTILIVETYQTAIRALNARSVTLPGQAELSKQALVGLGIPEDHIVIIPGMARSSIDEANSFLAFVNDKPWIDTINIITSLHHSYRSRLIFDRVFSSMDHNIELISCPSRYSEFNAKKWWTDKESTEAVITEYGKLIYGFLFEY